MTFLKRYSIPCGVVVFACLYYLLASQNIVQFLRVLPGELFHGLNNILIGFTRPLALSVISIFAYFAGLVIRRRNAEVWSERLILICVLVIALPFVLPFFTGTHTDTNIQFSAVSSSSPELDNARKPVVASPQSNFDSLITQARAGDVDSIMTVARLYCLGCDAAVKLDLRDAAVTSRTAADLSKYQRPAEDIREAFTWYQTAAQMGSIKAKNVVGEMLVHGVGVLQDMGKALQLFSDAARQGYVPAQFNLAAMYEYGYGVEKDILQAHMWYNIIASGAKDHTDEDAKYAKGLRDSLESKMTTPSLAQASEMARICAESKFRTCR